MTPGHAMDNDRSPALDVLRAVAIVLITNSHLDAIYPDARASTGGAFGNAVFFFISGWGLARGIAPTTRFAPWLLRRLSRIYLPLWLAVALITLMTPSHAARHNLPWPQTWLWPTWYWFVSAIMLFYPPFFVLARRFGARGLATALLALVPVYFAFYLTTLDLATESLEASRFKWIFYAQMMLLGGWFARRRPAPLPRSGIWLLASIAGFAAFKLGASAYGALSWQWVVHADVAIFTVSLYHVVARWCQRTGTARWQRAAAFLAGFAFEVYLVQELFNREPLIVNLGFPINFFVFWLLCLPSAWLLSRAQHRLRWLGANLLRWARSDSAAARGRP